MLGKLRITIAKVRAKNVIEDTECYFFHETAALTRTMKFFRIRRFGIRRNGRTSGTLTQTKGRYTLPVVCTGLNAVEH